MARRLHDRGFGSNSPLERNVLVVSRRRRRRFVLRVARSSTAAATTTTAEELHAQRVHFRNRKTFSQGGENIEAFHPDQMGGNGVQLDLDFATIFTARCPALVTLSGGLNPDNVARAIQAVHPYAVDVSSGVEESPGIKSPIMLRDFIQAARGAANAVAV